MSNRREKEAGRESHSASQGLGLPSNDVGIGRTTHSGRLSVKTACKCCSTTEPCSSKTNKKKPEESTEAAKKTSTGGVSGSEPKKSGDKTVPSRVRKARAPVEVKHTAASLARKETRGAQETAQMTRPPRSGKRPDPPAIKTADKSASPQQVWREKPQPESSDKKELSARKLQLHPSGVTSKPSTKTTNPSPPTSKLKKLSIQKEVKRKEPSAKDQSSKGKQVQEKQAKNKASTSESHSELTSYEYHIEWDGFTDIDESNNGMGVCCFLCEKDMGVAPYDDGNDNAIPVAAVLPCGHSFHNDCFNLGDFEAQQEEPPCIFCESFISS